MTSDSYLQTIKLAQGIKKEKKNSYNSSAPYGCYHPRHMRVIRYDKQLCFIKFIDNYHLNIFLLLLTRH
jgi:hypothetical protein